MKLLKKNIISIFLLSQLVFSEQDISVIYNSVVGEKYGGAGKLSVQQSFLEIDYSGVIPVSDNVNLLINEQYDGVTTASPKSEINSPFPLLDHPEKLLSSFGVEHRSTGRFRAKGFVINYLNSNKIRFPVDKEAETFLAYDTYMLMRNRFNADIYYELPLDRFLASVDFFYTNLVYDYERLGHIEQNRHDVDIWADMSAGYFFADGKLFLQCRGVLKHDLNEYNGYNLGEVFGGVKFKTRIFKKKLYLREDFFCRFYTSPVMSDKGYADEFGILSNLRLMYKLKPRLYLKGDVDYELAPVSEGIFLKQRYELTFRRAWKNYSHIEAGSWGSFGSLFPRICAYINANIALIPNLDILPGVRTYIRSMTSVEPIDENNELLLREIKDSKKFVREYKFSFYRTEFDLMLRYKMANRENIFLKNMGINCGMKFSLFSNLSENKQDSNISVDINTIRLFFGFATYL